MAIYAVGDIQGCYQALVKLLDEVNFDPAQDRLWAVGDLVNRGPQSLETLRLLRSLGDSFTTVLGNHDLHFLALANGAFDTKNKETLLPLLNAPDCQELCEWLRYLPLLHHETVKLDTGTEEFLMVHAGIAVGWDLTQALNYAKEVETALQGELYLEFLQAMYGNEPSLWHCELSGMARLRLITNIFTRMRFCNAQGRLDFDSKASLDSAPAGYKPWYQFQKLNQTLTILFGHWAALEGITNTPNVYALDTGCVWGRCLSALRLNDKKVFSTQCH